MSNYPGVLPIFVRAVGAAAGLFAVLAVFFLAATGGFDDSAAKAAFVARVAETAVSNAVSGGPGAPGGPAPASTLVPAAGAAPQRSLPAAGPGTTAHATSAARAASATGTPTVAARTGTSAGTSRTAPAGAPSTAGTPAPAGVPAAGPAPRRQPTQAEISQAISAVHNLVPFFSPSAAQITDVGNQVCTAFDQGQTFAQVTANALNMIGVGSFSWAIPSSVPAQAVRQAVALFCPAYSSKLG